MISFAYSLLTLTTFYATFYLTAMIKTDMVVFKRPETIESLTQLLHSDRHALWAELLDDSDSFRFADPKSTQGKLWSKACKRGLNESIIGTNQAAIAAHVTRGARR